MEHFPNIYAILSLPAPFLCPLFRGRKRWSSWLPSKRECTITNACFRQPEWEFGGAKGCRKRLRRRTKSRKGRRKRLCRWTKSKKGCRQTVRRWTKTRKGCRRIVRRWTKTRKVTWQRGLMEVGRGGACVPARVALQGRIHR